MIWSSFFLTVIWKIPLALLLLRLRLAVELQVEGPAEQFGDRAAKWGFSVMMRTSVALKVLQNSKIP